MRKSVFGAVMTAALAWLFMVSQEFGFDVHETVPGKNRMMI